MDDQITKWELDGGGSGNFNDTELFEGRLYTNRSDLKRAQLRARAKGIAGILAALIPFLVFAQNNRNF